MQEYKLAASPWVCIEKLEVSWAPASQATEQLWQSSTTFKLYDAADLEKTALVKMVRSGIPIDIRGKIYAKLLRVEKMNDYEKNFEIALKRTYGATIPNSPLPPTFGGRAHQSDLALTRDGNTLADHILCVIANDFPSLEYCPFVAPLTTLVCHFILTRDDALGIIVSVVKQSQTSTPAIFDSSNTIKTPAFKDWKFFPTFRKDVQFMSRGFSNLMHLINPKLHLQISNLQSNLAEPIWSRWLSDFFINVLPQQTIWRILDSFLIEGYKTLFRAGIALLTYKKDAIFKCTASSDLTKIFAETVADSSLYSEQFINSIWAVKFTGSVDIRKNDKVTLHDTISAISISEDLHEHEFRYQRALPKLKNSPAASNYNNDSANQPLESTIVKEEYWIVLWSWIPPIMRVMELECVFSTRMHGFHMTTLFNRTAGRKAMLLVVETAKGGVFGAYLSEAWPEDDSGRGVFYGTGESFLFTLAPFAKMYPWVGRIETENAVAGILEETESLVARRDYVRDQASMFIMTTRNEISIGGGGTNIGLWLNEDLSYGTTGYCQTFENNPLTGTQDKSFECMNVEIFAFSGGE